MGYTHYFEQARPFTEAEFAAIGEAVRKIIAASDVKIVREYDRTDEEAEITPDLIAFNGEGDDGHETFWLERGTVGGTFQFCKTARKPYDEVVVACLLAIEMIAPGALDLGSDGGIADWMDGRALVAEALGAPALEIPVGPV